MANSNVEVFNNLMSGNGTVNLSIVSYSDETDDPIIILTKEFKYTIILGPSGFDPDVGTGDLAKALFEISDGNMPDIFWDGVVPMSQMLFGQPKDEKLVMVEGEK